MTNRIAAWLCPTDVDRRRLLDASHRVRKARDVGAIVMGASVLFIASIYGWWMLAGLALALVNTQTLDRRLARSQRPELHIALSVLLIQSLVAAFAAVSGGPRSLALPLLVIPTAFAATRFRAVVARAYVIGAIVLLVTVCLVVDASATLAHPGGLLIASGTVIAVAAVMGAVSGAEIEKHQQSVLDPLTGLLNRSGLESHFEELAAHASVMDSPISMLICDIDHFKAVNDSRGHDHGDATLQGVAAQLRSQLRSFERIYRIGGEEFMVVLPDATAGDAARISERLRKTVDDALDVTISIGVSTLAGSFAQYGPLYKSADRGLYAAKRAGRNCVMTAPQPGRRTPMPV
jgi:diguanylate cyclase (GGDEF)-like protein